jgi:hypothetical protein
VEDIAMPGLLASVLLLVASLAAQPPAYALYEGTFAVNPCLAAKTKCVLKKTACLLNCHKKALTKGVPADFYCLTKCRDKFDLDPAVPGKGCFARVEAKGGCGASVGDAATFAAKIDAQVVDLAAQLNPGGGTPWNKCAAQKTGCVRSYNACVLGRVRDAMVKGIAIPALPACTAKLDVCMAKLEAKYCVPGPGCSSTAPPCLTYDDATMLRSQTDVFVDDAIAYLVVGPHDMNTQRCTGDTSAMCTSAPGGTADCGGPLGTCEFFFGAPRPYASGGIATCITNQWNGTITGTFDQATGASAGVASGLVRVYSGIQVAQPCPVCTGDTFPNDGASDGTCTGGPRNGQPCDGNGLSPETAFGVTSLDCPPGPAAPVATFPIDLTNTNTGTIAKTVAADSPNCSGAPGKKCLCASCSLNDDVPCENDAQCAAASAGTCSNAAGEPRKPNACIDDTSIPGDGTMCAPTGNGEGECPDSVIVDQSCAMEWFRSCLTDDDCPATHDHCTAHLRECYPGYNGNIGDSVSAMGATSDPRNGAAVMKFAAVYCMAPTDSNAVNSVAGFPGPGRVEFLGIGEDDAGPGCPSKASFMPTSKRRVVDAGWTGIVHDNLTIGQAKVTVAATCTGTHPNCSCSYTGPIPN